MSGWKRQRLIRGAGVDPRRNPELTATLISIIYELLFIIIYYRDHGAQNRIGERAHKWIRGSARCASCRLPSNHRQRIRRRRLDLPAFPWNTLATASAAFQFHKPRTASICFAGSRLGAEATAHATGAWPASRSHRAKPGRSCGQSARMRRLRSTKLCS